MVNTHSTRKPPAPQGEEQAKAPPGYKAVYAPLLVHHMSQGYSLASFAALATNKAAVVRQDPTASWPHCTKDFYKETCGAVDCGALAAETP